MRRTLEDLARSGIGARAARELRVRELSPSQTKKITKRYDVASYRIPYFDQDGREVDFFRLRLLDPVDDVKEGRRVRYWQPPGTLPEPYLPPSVDWEAFVASADPLIVTEGEKKAACGAMLLGRAVVGLGGVFSFKSKSHRVSLLPGLVPLVKGRAVYLCFDADAEENPDVALARRALAQAAARHGAECYKLLLPGREGSKVGLDDFLVARGPKAFGDLKLVRVGEEEELERLNGEVALIAESHAYYHLATGGLFSDVRRLSQITFADRVVTVYNQKGEPVEKNAFAEWTRWPNRQTYSRLAYEPGKPRLNGGSLNVWPGWAVEPMKGDVGPFEQLIGHMFRNALPEHMRWFVRWLAYPLRHPGAKLYTAVLLFSLKEGVGKSLVGETMGRIYGKNFSAIQAAQLHSSFNGWAKHRQFILGDEVTGRDRREDIDRLKSLITQEAVLVNQKYQEPYSVRDCANYILTTNRPEALAMAHADRRFFVHEVEADPLPASFYREYDAWYRSPAGAAALFHHLLRVDLGDFNPHGDAPHTRAKGEMAALAATPVEYDVAALIESPGRWLLDSPRDLYTAHELSQLLNASGAKGASAIAVGRALKALRVPSFVIGVGGQAVRLCAVRNRGRWEKATHAERAAHYAGESAGAAAAAAARVRSSRK